MDLSDKDIRSAVRSQLATDLNCSPGDFDSDGFVFSEAKENPGRRPFPRGERHFEMVTTGSAVVVSATPDILPYLRGQLIGKNRDDAFSMPFVYGTGVCFLPDNPCPLPTPDGIEITVLERDHILKLYGLYQRTDFPNAIQHDAAHPRPDVLATLATVDGKTAGMAGASADCETLWQIGIDVRPEYRDRNIAAALTNRLAIEILERGKIPYYGTALSNIASQRVAHRAGFKPAWACAYRGRFDDVLTEPTG
ncbi:MAG: GNAT family N-acetyltransferase [Synergistaceae bacterium]|jgi:GNAT superfamily N-acetyltransferase|nr:GNAT family N-acetyltransferase [Synergistaceae bacterium]